MEQDCARKPRFAPESSGSRFDQLNLAVDALAPGVRDRDPQIRQDVLKVRFYHLGDGLDVPQP